MWGIIKLQTLYNTIIIFLYLLVKLIMKHYNEIDISKTLAEKNPNIFKFTPNLILNKLKTLIHQDEINEILFRLKGKEGLDFIKEGLQIMNVRSKSIGFENLPKNEGVVIVANHPLGGMDGVTLIKELGEYRTDIQFLVNDILTQIEPFKTFFIPVNKHGSNPRESLMKIDQLYQTNKCIVVFPAGLVSRKQKKKIKDLQWKKSFITRVKKHNKTIYPVHISGQNSNRFYNTANWRKKIGIKANLEMLLLADEMFKQKGSTITFTMGKPISYKQLTNQKNDLEWAQIIKEHVYELENNPNFEFKESNFK